MITFEWLWILFALPLPLLMYLAVPKAETKQPALLVPFYQQLQHPAQGERKAQRHPLSSLLTLCLIWITLVLAAARPLWVGKPVTLPTSGRDLLLAVDISGSMEAEDMEIGGYAVNRLSAVKKVVGDFVNRRVSDRLGLVLFGSRAYLQAPLTFDRATVNRLLQEAELGFAGEKTAIGDAIGLAIKRLRSRPESSRVLILLTDGANTSGEVSPLKAAELGAKAKVKIYTIGIGADVMEVNSLFGTRRINPSRDLDEETLTTIAKTTGGQYFRARNASDLERIYEELDELEPIEQEQETFRPIKALFYWPLSLAMVLSFILALSKIHWESLFRPRTLFRPQADMSNKQQDPRREPVL